MQNLLDYLLANEYLNPKTLEEFENKNLSDANINHHFGFCFSNDFRTTFLHEFLKITNRKFSPYVSFDKQKFLKSNFAIYGGFYTLESVRDRVIELCLSTKNSVKSEFEEFLNGKCASFLLLLENNKIVENSLLSDMIFTFGDDELELDSVYKNKGCDEIFLSETFEVNFSNLFISTTPYFLKESKDFRLKDGEFDAFVSSVFSEINESFRNLELKTLQNLFDIIKGVLQSKLSFAFKNVNLNSLNEFVISGKESSFLDFSSFKCLVSFTNETDTLLNSFFLSDLALVKDRFKNDKANTLLKEYFGLKEALKIDIVKDDFGKAREIFCANEFVKGAFFSKYKLNFLQQFALNLMFKKFKNSDGIYSVNGPPGTGKTTLVKDIIANIIINRAEILLGIDKRDFWQKDDRRDLYVLNEKLYGFEMIIASSNNKAIENISQNIPLALDIDDNFSLDYFADFASKLLGKECWGLICATLGNKKNKNIFKKRCLGAGEIKNKTDIKYKKLIYDSGVYGLSHFLFNFNKSFSDYEYDSVEVAKDKFKRSLQKVQDLIDEMFKIQSDILSLKNEAKEIGARVDELDKMASELLKRLGLNTLDEKNIDKKIEFLRHTKPNWLSRIFNKKRFHNWQSEYEGCIKLCNILSEKSDLQARLLKTNENASDFFKIDSSELLLGSYFDNDEYFAATKDCFKQALNLHKAFIIENSSKFGTNLNMAFSENVSDADKLLAFKSLFFIVPAISTTLASVARFLSFAKDSEFGYALFDEAGQASLSAGVGLLMRCKKAVVVGDPLQLEPVVVLPKSVNQILIDNFNVPSSFDVTKNSLQSRADIAQNYGAYIDGTWVGSPLLVHRRCNKFMFDIANEISYGGLMVSAKKVDEFSFGFKDCVWFDVKSEKFDKHFSDDEFRVAIKFYEALTQKYQSIKASDIAVISPFKSVADNIRGKFKTKSETSISGTIHTMQGREAKLIILILGGASEGAREWVCATPNLLNVAVTRAKEVLVIVGDFDNYKNLNLFRDFVFKFKREKIDPNSIIFSDEK